MSQLQPLAGQLLRGELEGEVILPGEQGYDEARAVWNGRFDPKPAVVIRCRGTGDVQTALRFAREHDLQVSVRGGGHSYAGLSIVDGSLAIDLSPMNAVRINPELRTATVRPGATWREFDSAAQAFDLATTGATVSSVGVAGFTLGGGTGYLARKHGLGLDNLISAEVVTADSRVLRASEDENEDLFWALRGGGGNFGVVTSFEFRLHPIGPEVMTAQAFHPIEDAVDVLRFYRELTANAPDELAVFAFALRVPPVDPFPEARHGSPALALIACHCGDVRTGEAELETLAAFGEPFLAAVQTTSYVAAQQAFDAGMPKGLRWYSRAHYLDVLSDEAIDTFARQAASLQGPFTIAYLEPLGGAVQRVDPGATAFPARDAAFGLHILPGWTDATDDEPLMRWAREFHREMAPHSTGGVYVNLLGEDEADRIPAAYGENHARLERLKSKWDPENRFRGNQNIAPRS